MAARFGPAKDSPWTFQRAMANSSPSGFATRAAVFFVVVLVMPVLAINAILVGFWPITYLIILTTSFFVFWIMLRLAAAIEKKTIEERRESIVWYPSLSLPAFSTKRSRIGYGILAAFVAVSIGQQVYEMMWQDAEIGLLPLSAILLAVLLVGLRPAKSQDVQPRETTDG